MHTYDVKYIRVLVIKHAGDKFFQRTNQNLTKVVYYIYSYLVY